MGSSFFSSFVKAKHKKLVSEQEEINNSNTKLSHLHQGEK